MFQVNVTEQMVDAQPQEIITNDNLNARVDACNLLHKRQQDEESVKTCSTMHHYEWQIVNLPARRSGISSAR